MRIKSAVILSLLMLAVLGVATESYAAISDAAVLFLRIAPGARAAAMGEAFVAIADDATATHYNPAGLGASPMASSWIQSRVPAEYRPLKGMAAMKARSGSSYLSYDIWALTKKGLIRFDNRQWRSGETKQTHTDDTMEKVVSQYFGMTDKDKISAMVLKVAEANSPESFASVKAFHDSLLALVPADYKNTKSLTAAADSLLTLYPECRISWEDYKEVRNRFSDARDDKNVSETKIDRIGFALERVRNRLIPEDVIMPYSCVIDGEPTSIAAISDGILVGTTNGLYQFTGKVWRHFGGDGSLASDSIQNLSAVGGMVLAGTPKGIVRFNGQQIVAYDTSAHAPTGNVQAVGGENTGNVWAVVDGDLYNYNGSTWSNRRPYTVALDDTPEKIAAHFALYGSAEEKKQYLTKLRGGSDTGAYPAMNASQTIAVPYLAGIKGQVNGIATGMGKTVWIATQYGVIYLDKDKWFMPGYHEVTIDSATTLTDYLAKSKEVSAFDRAELGKTLTVLNDLSGDALPAGTKIMVSRKPVPAVGQVEKGPTAMMLATDDGLYEYADGKFVRSQYRGLSDAPARDMSKVGDRFWIAGDDRIVTNSPGRSELSLMYVKWLPELAPDLYYSFMSFVKPTNNWGTFGGNITYISYGKFQRTKEGSPTVVGEFQSFDIAATISYGNSLSNRLKGGMSAKVIYSKLSDLGSGTEKGKGTSTGFALDFGLLYQMSARMNWGLAITNIGPKMSYIDANQSDDLPRNLALGCSYKFIQGTYVRLLGSVEINKLLVSMSDKPVINTGAEFAYANLISGRLGYIYDQEGKIKVATLGMGLSPIDNLKFDVSWVPNGQNVALNNTLRYSVAFVF
jgi:hypothetical protein